MLSDFLNRFRVFRNGNNYINSGDIRRSLDRHGIPYEHYRQPTSINITKCFDEASEDGSLLLDFLVQVKSFNETAPVDLKRQVLDYLASSEFTEKSGGETMVITGYDIIIVTKPVG